MWRRTIQGGGSSFRFGCAGGSTAGRCTAALGAVTSSLKICGVRKGGRVAVFRGLQLDTRGNIVLRRHGRGRCCARCCRLGRPSRRYRSCNPRFYCTLVSLQRAAFAHCAASPQLFQKPPALSNTCGSLCLVRRQEINTAIRMQRRSVLMPNPGLRYNLCVPPRYCYMLDPCCPAARVVGLPTFVMLYVVAMF